MDMHELKRNIEERMVSTAKVLQSKSYLLRILTLKVQPTYSTIHMKVNTE